MRTIDPFLAPGLWGGARKPPRPLAAEYHPSPLKCSAASGAPIIANAPLASLAGSALARCFHAWFGRSGQRYVCSVFAVNENDESMGLPHLTGAVVIAVGGEADGLRALSVFTLDESRDQKRHAEAAVAAGARAWHVHLPSGKGKTLAALLLDFTA